MEGGKIVGGVAKNAVPWKQENGSEWRFCALPWLAPGLHGGSRTRKSVFRIQDKPRPPGDRPTNQMSTAMLRKVDREPRHESFLAGFRLPAISFEHKDLPFRSLDPIWEAMREGRTTDARSLAAEATQERRLFPPEERAALYAAQAAAELKLGATDTAKRLAGKSLDLLSDQFMAHRVLLTVHVVRKDFTAAYLHLANLVLPARAPRWDDVLSYEQVHVALAAWAWQLGEWDQVADHLSMAWPAGLASMPAEVREDWFKLSLYRGSADDAAAAAASLLEVSSETHADDILQTIVQSGWTGHALPLYREFYERNNQSELIRRRIVGLCVKEGHLEEARRLTLMSPLKMAA